jgi:hypothetical protein
VNKNLLLKLLAHAHRSVAEVKSSMPDLFAALQGLALDEAREKLTAEFADAAPELQKRIAALHLVDVAPTAIPGLVRKALAANLTPEQADDGGDRLAELEAAGAFHDPLAQGDAVVGELPLVQEELELARVYIVADLAKLDDARAAKVVARARSLAELDDDALAQAVAAGELNEAAAKDLGLSSSLYQLLNDDHARAAAVKGARIDGVPGGRLTTLRDLAALDAKAWRELLQRANVALPAGVERDGGGGDRERPEGEAPRAGVQPAAGVPRGIPGADERRAGDGGDLRDQGLALPGVRERGREDDPGDHGEGRAEDGREGEYERGAAGGGCRGGGGVAGDDALGGLPAKAIKGQFARAVKGSHTVAVGATGGLGPRGRRWRTGWRWIRGSSSMCCSMSSTA